MRRLIYIVCMAALLVAVAFPFRGPILRGYANAWTVSNTLARADAIIVLGGGIGTRPAEAARLFKAGHASKIVILNCLESPSEKLTFARPQAELNHDVLLKLGVSASAIVTTGTNVSSTRDEAQAIRRWVQAVHAKSIIVPTEFPHTRRVAWIFRKALEGTGTSVAVDPINALQFTPTNWWQHEEGLTSMQNELVKYLYYRVRY